MRRAPTALTRMIHVTEPPTLSRGAASGKFDTDPIVLVSDSASSDRQERALSLTDHQQEGGVRQLERDHHLARIGFGQAEEGPEHGECDEQRVQVVSVEEVREAEDDVEEAAAGI